MTSLDYILTCGIALRDDMSVLNFDVFMQVYSQSSLDRFTFSPTTCESAYFPCHCRETLNVNIKLQ